MPRESCAHAGLVRLRRCTANGGNGGNGAPFGSRGGNGGQGGQCIFYGNFFIISVEENRIKILGRVDVIRQGGKRKKRSAYPCSAHGGNGGNGGWFGGRGQDGQHGGRGDGSGRLGTMGQQGSWAGHGGNGGNGGDCVHTWGVFRAQRHLLPLTADEARQEMVRFSRMQLKSFSDLKFAAGGRARRRGRLVQVRRDGGGQRAEDGARAVRNPVGQR